MDLIMSKIKQLEEYVKALCGMHPQQAFWVFDTNWNMVYANPLNYDFFNFRIYSYFADEVINSKELKFYLENNLDKDAINHKGVEFLGFYEINKLLRSMILELIPLIVEKELIGYVVLCLGDLCDFESSNIVNMILFGASKRAKSGVPDGTRLLEISFFLMRGKNYREIAEILSKIHNKRISSSTIGNMVRNFLYPRFDVCNRMALKKALYKSDIYGMLPKTIFKAQYKGDKNDG